MAVLRKVLFGAAALCFVKALDPPKDEDKADDAAEETTEETEKTVDGFTEDQLSKMGESEEKHEFQVRGIPDFFFRFLFWGSGGCLESGGWDWDFS